MARKTRKGYYIDGEFVPEGGALDMRLRAGSTGAGAASRSDRKRASADLQVLGESLLALQADAFTRLQLPQDLRDALEDARRISARGGKRRQLQFIGKLMRQQDPGTIDSIRAAVQAQHRVSARGSAALHAAESWRDRLIADGAALGEWLDAYPATDAEQLRALIGAAREDARPGASGDAPRHSRAYRAVFQLVRQQLQN